MKVKSTFPHLLFIALIACCCHSCGDAYYVDTEKHNLDASSKLWIYDEELFPDIILQDSIGRMNKYLLIHERSSYIVSSWTGMLGLGKEKDYFEFILQELKSQKNFFSVFIQAQEPPRGNSFKLDFGDCCFSYDFLFNKLIYLRSGFNSKSASFKENTYESTIRSRMMFIDSLEVGESVYYNVFRFELKDFKTEWTDSTIISLSYAQQAGLIEYKTFGGEVWVRK